LSLIQNENAVDKFNDLASEVMEEIHNRSFAIFDGTIRIQLDDVQITESDIRFRTTGYQERIFYAACATAWNCHLLNPVDGAEEEARLFHLPPVKYQKVHEESGYHLIIDMFQNGWVERTLRIPVFRPSEELKAKSKHYPVLNRFLHNLSERDSTNVPETRDT